MPASLGSAALGVAFLTAVFAVVTALTGATGERRWVDISRRSVYAPLRAADLLRRPHRDRLRQRRLLLQHRPAALLDRDADLLQDGGDVVEPGGLAAALGLGPLDRRLAGPLRDPRQAPRAGPLGDRRDGRGRRLLHRPDALRRRRQPLRDARPGARRRRRPQPAAPAPEHDDPPADALLGLRGVHGAVRLRDRRPRHPPHRRRLDPRHAALRADRLGAARLRPPARRPLVLHRARLGRLLGLGPGGERGADAVAGRHRLPALDHGPGEARHAEGLERLPDRRHLLAGAARHLPRPLRRPAVDPRLRRQHRRPLHPRPDRGRPDRLDGADRLPPRRPALGEADRLADLARGRLPRQQPAAGRAHRGDLLGHLLPADLGTVHRRQGLAGGALVRPLHDAAGDPARPLHRHRAAARLAPGQLGLGEARLHGAGRRRRSGSGSCWRSPPTPRPAPGRCCSSPSPRSA